MTREEKLYSMRMVDLKTVADKRGIKINTKAAKSEAVKIILAAEEMNKQNEKELKKEKAENDAYVAEVMQQKKDLGIECPKIESYEVVYEDTCADGTPLAEVGKEISEQAKIKAETAKKSKKSNMIEYNGKTQNLTQWAKELGKPVQTLYYRIKMKGWDIEKAFTK
jgi:hypothetical protein